MVPQSPSTCSRAVGALPSLALALLLVAGLLLPSGCGDETTRIQRCGDGVCATDENEVTCARDCPSFCTPGQARCLNNVLLTCTPDGRNELEQPCEAGTYCTADGCMVGEGTGGGS